jgi:hypothetical protein
MSSATRSSAPLYRQFIQHEMENQAEQKDKERLKKRNPPGYP